MQITTFSTILAAASGQYKEKGSKFLAFAYPVASEEDIKLYLDTLRKEYFDARHHCYAWMLGPERNRFRANDDGEPNHSAGDPILGQIKSKGLTDVLIVVVRYFGGTKLGVGGLISAYKTAAEEALKNAKVIEKDVTRIVTLIFPYEATSEAMRLVKEFELKIIDQGFDNDCFLKASIGLARHEAFLSKLELLQHTGSSLRLSVS